MNEQDQLAAFRHVLAKCVAERDAVRLLGDELRARAHQLLKFSKADPDEVLAAVTLLHWHRFLMMPSPEDGEDLYQALTLFGQISMDRRDLLPAPIRHLFTTGAAERQHHSVIVWDVAHWVIQAVDILAGYHENRDPCSIDTAIAFLVRARSAACNSSTEGLLLLRPYPVGTVTVLTGVVDRARAKANLATGNAHLQCHLSLMLCDLYELSGAFEYLEEAMVVAREAATCAAVTKDATPLLASCCLVLLCGFRHAHDERILADAKRWLEEAIDATQRDDVGVDSDG